LWSSSLCSFLHSPVTSSLSDPNILLNTLFSNTLSLCSSLNVRDQVSRPYRTTSNTVYQKLVLMDIVHFSTKLTKCRVVAIISVTHACDARLSVGACLCPLWRNT
jgi:hypothetical protein